MDDPQPPRPPLGLQWGFAARSLALAIGHTFALLPRRFRFRAALALARSVAPLVVGLLARTRYRGPLAYPVDATLRVFCRAMTAAGTYFDPEVRYDGPVDLAGALLLSIHLPLNALVARQLFDMGTPPAILKRMPLADPYYWGTFVRDEVLESSPTVLVRVRSILASGRPVLMHIDTAEESPGTIPVKTAAGTLHIATATIAFAQRTQVPLYVASGRTAKSGLPLVLIHRIEPNVDAFVARLRDHLER